MRRTIYIIALAVCSAFLFRAFVVEGIYIASASMEPTLLVGENLFVEKLSILFSRPKRGDIIVFPSPEMTGRDLVKRVIGIPGDVIELRSKKVYLNNSELKEPYVKYTRPQEILKGDNIDTLEVPKGMLFVLGDNRDESGDSRDWIDKNTGNRIYFFPIKKVKGKVVLFVK